MKFKSCEYAIVLFIVNAISMVLELVAARILSPVIGSSNMLWTFIISMMLFSNAVGNYLGGIISEKYNLDVLNVILLFVSGISIVMTAVINNLYIVNVTSKISDSQADGIIIILALFMIPCVCIGMISPVVNKKLLADVSNIGKISGKIYTIITAGSLVGTLFGGLILIPFFGSEKLLFFMAYICIGISLIEAVLTAIEKWKSDKSDMRIMKLNMIFTSFIALILCISIFIPDVLTRESVSDIIVLNTGENYIRIYDEPYRDQDVKWMNISGGYSSANYNDPAKRDELVFDYNNTYNKIIEKCPEMKDFMMIGGAGYSYPRYLVSHYPDKSIDVVEIDEGVTEAALRYFYLDDFIKEYGTDRLGLYTNDGRIYLDETEKKYDVILNDAFVGEIPPRSLATKEAVESIKNSLKDGGIYATNIMGSFQNERAPFLCSEIKTIASVFKYVWAINASLDEKSYRSYNNIVIASDTDYDFESMPYSISESDIVFTDDYAPVEYFHGIGK